MKKLFKDWTRFEIALFVLGATLITFSSILCKSDFLTIFASLVGILCSLLQAKGKIISQFVQYRCTWNRPFTPTCYGSR